MSKTLLKGVKIQARGDSPLWLGPESDHELGGVTQSMLCDFLTCRERFRVKHVLGLRPSDHFNHHIEYGQMWHVCEEALAQWEPTNTKRGWEAALRNYVDELSKRYPFDRDRIAHWYNVCKFQFPLYVDHWRKHPDVKNRTPVEQEQVFRVPYKLPSGRIVHLRGKRDAVDTIDRCDWLFETKTKGDLDPVKLQRQLKFDLQTMMYLTAMHVDPSYKNLVKGVRYNVIRRPLSGGKGSIIRHKAKVTKKGTTPEETLESFYERAAQYVKDDPEHYFMRWKVDVSAADVAKFRRECLDPILETLCEWYDYIVLCGENGNGVDPWTFSRGAFQKTVVTARHYRHPFGVRNMIDEFGYSDLDEYLATGSEVGLRKVNTLFTELQ